MNSSCDACSHGSDRRLLRWKVGLVQSRMLRHLQLTHRRYSLPTTIGPTHAPDLRCGGVVLSNIFSEQALPSPWVRVWEPKILWPRRARVMASEQRRFETARYFFFFPASHTRQQCPRTRFALAIVKRRNLLARHPVPPQHCFSHSRRICSREDNPCCVQQAAMLAIAHICLS